MNETYDVIVVGYGFAGAVAAIAAHDAGAKVLLIEKMKTPGGISICSAGGIRISKDKDQSLRYLERTNGDTAPVSLLDTLATGMTEISSFVEKLAAKTQATTKTTTANANYPFPGYDSFGFISIASIENYDQDEAYPNVRGMRGGARLFQVLERNLADRGIEVLLSSPVKKLLREGERIVGIEAQISGKMTALSAQKAVILACGGFEASAEMQKSYWQEQDVQPVAFLGNEGDGIRMAQAVGADLWHMWHYHGTYGVKHPDPKYPFAIRLARLPDWLSGHGFPENNAFATGSKSDQPRMPWIVLDKNGRRFMNEYPPYLQDTGHRAMAHYNPDTQNYPRIPAWLVLDDEGRQLFPLGMPSYHQEGVSFEWSEDNKVEIEAGILHQASSLEELSQKTGIALAVLKQSIEDWNECCKNGLDEEFGRPSETMMAIKKPPFVFAELWPIVSNTQGGPVHDDKNQVLNPFGEAIPGLYAAGELGSLFGHLYLSGGNIAECFIGGKIAGENAAAES